MHKHYDALGIETKQLIWGEDAMISLSLHIPHDVAGSGEIELHWDVDATWIQDLGIAVQIQNCTL